MINIILLLGFIFMCAMALYQWCHILQLERELKKANRNPRWDPPQHFNCRSVMEPVLAPDEELVADGSRPEDATIIFKVEGVPCEIPYDQRHRIKREAMSHRRDIGSTYNVVNQYKARVRLVFKNYISWKLEAAGVTIVFYPHKTTAGHTHIRIRNENSKDINLAAEIMWHLNKVGFPVNNIHGHWGEQAFKLRVKGGRA